MNGGLTRRCGTRTTLCRVFTFPQRSTFRLMVPAPAVSMSLMRVVRLARALPTVGGARSSSETERTEKLFKRGGGSVFNSPLGWFRDSLIVWIIAGIAGAIVVAVAVAMIAASNLGSRNITVATGALAAAL